MKLKLHKKYCEYNAVNAEGLWLMCPLLNISEKSCEFFGDGTDKKIIIEGGERHIKNLRTVMCRNSCHTIEVDCNEF